MNGLYAVASGIPDHSKCGANCSLKWPSAEYLKHHPHIPYQTLLQINTPPIIPTLSPVTTPIITTTDTSTNTATENKK